MLSQSVVIDVDHCLKGAIVCGCDSNMLQRCKQDCSGKCSVPSCPAVLLLDWVVAAAVHLMTPLGWCPI